MSKCLCAYFSIFVLFCVCMSLRWLRQVAIQVIDPWARLAAALWALTGDGHPPKPLFICFVSSSSSSWRSLKGYLDVLGLLRGDAVHPFDTEAGVVNLGAAEILWASLYVNYTNIIKSLNKSNLLFTNKSTPTGLPKEDCEGCLKGTNWSFFVWCCPLSYSGLDYVSEIYLTCFWGHLQGMLKMLSCFLRCSYCNQLQYENSRLPTCHQRHQRIKSDGWRLNEEGHFRNCYFSSWSRYLSQPLYKFFTWKEKAVVCKNTFLKGMVMLWPALMLYGPWAFGGRQTPCKGKMYSPPFAEDSLSWPVTSPSWWGSKQTSTLASDPAWKPERALTLLPTRKSGWSVWRWDNKDGK